MIDPVDAPHRLWQKAASFAARAHLGQVRKDGRTPYVAHPFRVAMIVRDVFGCEDESVIAGALLHDTIEDTTTDYDELRKVFGEDVAAIVAAMTKDMRLPERLREPAYDEQLRKADWRARLVKLADTFDNLCDVFEADLSKVIEKAERAVALASADASQRPETRRALEALRKLMRERARPKA
jgi:(p)ppGpp synthase/HD superfamily hydrolase